MTQTPKNETAAEAPLTWHAKTVWGSVGRTYHAAVTLANGDNWAFTVDQPRKGYWVARGWCDGDMKFYREGARTLKDAKAQSQAHANLAARATCSECGRIAGHTEACPAGRTAEAVSTMSVMADRLTKAPVLMTDEGARLLAEAGKSASASTSRLVKSLLAMKPSVVRLNEAMLKLAEVMRANCEADLTSGKYSRPCGCHGITHTMRCGVGGRPVVVANHWSRLIDEVRTMEFKDGA